MQAVIIGGGNLQACNDTARFKQEDMSNKSLMNLPTDFAA